MKKKITLIALVLFIIFIIATVIYAFKFNKTSNPVYITSDCTKKGYLCGKEELKKGVIVSFDVNEKETYDFFVISNTEEEMVLLSSDVVGNKTSWNTEQTNVKGPVTPLFELYDATYKWSDVATINGYVYEDYGYKQCLTSSSPDEYCITGGYHKIVIDNSSYVETNIEGTTNKYFNYELGEYNFKSRLITVEEVLDLEIPLWLAEDLENGQGFWTMSASTAANTGFSSGAYAIMKINDEVKIESIPVSNELMRLKAVITVPKS